MSFPHGARFGKKPGNPFKLASASRKALKGKKLKGVGKGAIKRSSPLKDRMAELKMKGSFGKFKAA